MRTLNLSRSQYQIADDISSYLDKLGYNNTVKQNVSVLDINFVLTDNNNVRVRIYWSSTKLHKVSYFTCDKLHTWNNWNNEVSTLIGDVNSFRQLKQYIKTDIDKLNKLS
jgi:hypothetical protein